MKRFGLATWLLGWGVYRNAHGTSGLLKETYRPYMIRMFSKKNR